MKVKVTGFTAATLFGEPVAGDYPTFSGGAKHFQKKNVLLKQVDDFETIYQKRDYKHLKRNIMKSEAKLLLGLGIGIALGAAVGYIMGSDRREEWLDQTNAFADKVRANVKSAIYKGKSEVSDLKEDIDDIAEIAKRNWPNTETQRINYHYPKSKLRWRTKRLPAYLRR